MRHDGDDEYNLPRVDVVVPDDARELDADVATWRYEEQERLRAEREERMHRLLRPIARHGLALPVMVLTVALALVSGLLITFFGPRPVSHTPPAPLASPTAAVGSVGGRLPDVQVVVNATSRPAASLRPALVVILPPECGCEQQLHELARQAIGRSLRFYLLADLRAGDRSPAEAREDLRPMANRITETVAGIVDDPENALAAAYDAQGLTAITVRPDGLVAQVLRDLDPVIDPRLVKV